MASFACGARTSGRSAPRVAVAKVRIWGFYRHGWRQRPLPSALPSYCTRLGRRHLDAKQLPPRYAVKNTPRQAVASIVHRTIVNRAVPTLL